ncbi:MULTISPECIES: hypothetical protein [unclassified Paenibacillus]|uniref:hypothetical protein n=1 Tax=unclassified Paenibacillus TaxID=185978 RepID=UPI0003E1C1CA|nr:MULTISPECIES: hypothetical protein [unclassified Paenibacillus]ETT41476.1 hypothetical protein C162_26380 [Paenibacillus sp. FSL R7-269]OMG00474.1 hypothetical protein BK147_04560 [Paenibacillus sp. FSL R7-0337]
MIGRKVFKTAAISCLTLAWSFPVYADKVEVHDHSGMEMHEHASMQNQSSEVSDTSSMVHGVLETKYSYTGMTLDQVRSHFEKLNLNLEDLVAQSTISIDDGVASINTELPEATVLLDNQSVEVVDKEFMFHEVTPGAHDLQVYSYDTLVYDSEINIEKGTNQLPVEVNLDINEIVERAKEKMENPQEKSISINDVLFQPQTDSFVTPMSDPDSWNGYHVGQILGKGKGKMLLLTNQGHVSCNKSDYDQGANFPYNNSDCALAVSGGALFQSNKVLYSAYEQGVFCVKEAMNSVENPSAANGWCNWQAKPNAVFVHNYLNKGYNCSSFMFLGNDERLNKF